MPSDDVDWDIDHAGEVEYVDEVAECPRCGDMADAFCHVAVFGMDVCEDCALDAEADW